MRAALVSRHRKLIGALASLGLGSLLWSADRTGPAARAQNAGGSPVPLIACTVYPALPAGFPDRSPVTALRGEHAIVLANAYLAVEIGARTGVITKVGNKLTGEEHRVAGDLTGFAVATAAAGDIAWEARDGVEQTFRVEIAKEADGSCRATFTLDPVAGRPSVAIMYTLGAGQFWVERRLALTTGPAKYERLTYGAVQIAGGTVQELKLGKFDAPRLIARGRGGVFAGVGWWFYEVNGGIYQNTRMNYETAGRFEAEPWYLGVFRPEAGEPYRGWLWYKTFLAERKFAHDKQRSYALWNARSGYSFDPINNARLLDFVATAARVGLNGITTGEVRGLEKGTRLAASDPVARKVIDAYAAQGVDFSLHEGDVQAANWRTEAGLARKLKALDDARQQGIRALTVDFLGVDDRFADHRRVTTFFRHLRAVMSYSECHLGMAAYGPQFQREVLLNHPTDLKGFDIGRFSSDWATLVGFRHSRREWQRRYQYLMPENGLFYFCTHYSNYPRNYEEPERQQFLYIADAWRGLAYAFHDQLGFRDAVAAQAAFSTFYVFGFLDDRMPRAEADFARAWLAWVEANASLLCHGRVCFESEDALVMSKVSQGRGAIFVLNFRPGRKRFKLKLELPDAGALQVRPIYPSRGEPLPISAANELEVEVPGERPAIFEVNEGLRGRPPENSNLFPVDVTGWRRSGDGWIARVEIPAVRADLARRRNPGLPQLLVSADQVETELVLRKPAGKSLGKLPREFLDAYGFIEDKYLPAWKAVPWAFADRVWLVHVPRVAPKLTERPPVVRVNERELTMSPRVRYDPRDRNAAHWDAPLWFADVTEICRYGGENEVVLSGVEGEEPGPCFLAAVAGWEAAPRR